MRGCLFVVVGSLVGCTDPLPVATVTITSPESGVVITDHEPLTITVDVSGAPVKNLELSVDGEIVPGISTTPLPNNTDCSACSFTLTWDTQQEDEGPNVVTVLVYGGSTDDLIGYADLALSFDDTPEITALIPTGDEDLTGVGMMEIELGVIDRGATTVKLEIDGVELSTEERASCKSPCAFTWPWDTTALAAGMHELKFTVSDAKGHVVEQTRMVTLDDQITVTAMQVTGVTDGGALEIEVYVFDDVTNMLIGCVGSAGGMGPVDASDVRYDLDATLIDLAGSTLGSLDLPNPVRFEVWEDDDQPVCPTPFSPSGNDMVGVSAAQTAAQWKATTMSTFGNVVELRTVFERPLQR
jgi:hypothetical protein